MANYKKKGLLTTVLRETIYLHKITSFFSVYEKSKSFRLNWLPGVHCGWGARSFLFHCILFFSCTEVVLLTGLQRLHQNRVTLTPFVFRLDTV